MPANRAWNQDVDQDLDPDIIYTEQLPKSRNNTGKSDARLEATNTKTWSGPQQPNLQPSVGIFGRQDGRQDEHQYNTSLSSTNIPPGPGMLERHSTLGVLNDNMGALSFQSVKRRANDETNDVNQRSESSVKHPRTATGGSARISQLINNSALQRVTSQRSHPNLRPQRNLSNSPLSHQRQRSWPTRAPGFAITPYNSAPLEPGATPSTPAGRSDSVQAQPPSSISSHGRKGSVDSNSHVEQPHSSLVLQPDSRPMPAGQLAAEIKAIYSGLVMIEAKCIGVVQTENNRLREIKLGKKPQAPPLADVESHWPALISLHRALLQEHHDFFLASQHPASSPQLKNLATKYSMPARMWKHGIHSFLELLRHSLPESMEFMQAFIILAYQMIALLYETVDSFKDTWIECLGDLARYRMAIEDEDPKDRDIYTTVSKSWYSKASRRNVQVGRLYHHQAILARTQPLKQLSLYARSLGAYQPFNSARESIMTLFEPVLSRLTLPGSNSASIDSRFIRLHALRFTDRKHLMEQYKLTREEFLANFDTSISQAGQAWRIIGEYMAIIQITSLLEFGDSKSPLREIFLRKESTTAPRRTHSSQGSLDREYRERLSIARDFKSRTADEWRVLISMLKIVLSRRNDDNVLPFIHMITAFIWALSSVQYGTEYVDEKFPFSELSEFLNMLLNVTEVKLDGGDKIVLREERSMHGQVFSQKLLSANHFPDPDSEEEEYQEVAATTKARKDRIIALCYGIAAKGASDDTIPNKSWLSFDNNSRRFSAVARDAKSSPTKPPTSPLENVKVSAPGEVTIVGEDHHMMGTETV